MALRVARVPVVYGWSSPSTRDARLRHVVDQCLGLNGVAGGVQAQGQISAGAQGVRLLGALVPFPQGDQRVRLGFCFVGPAQDMQSFHQQVAGGPAVAVTVTVYGDDVLHGGADEVLGRVRDGAVRNPGQGEAAAQGGFVRGAQGGGRVFDGSAGEFVGLRPALLLAEIAGEPGDREQGVGMVRLCWRASSYRPHCSRTRRSTWGGVPEQWPSFGEVTCLVGSAVSAGLYAVLRRADRACV